MSPFNPQSEIRNPQCCFSSDGDFLLIFSLPTSDKKYGGLGDAHPGQGFV
jgi:hypothetical protein